MQVLLWIIYVSLVYNLSSLEIIVQRELQFSEFFFLFGMFNVLVIFHVVLQILHIGLHLELYSLSKNTNLNYSELVLTQYSR